MFAELLLDYISEHRAIPSVRTSCMRTWVSMGSSPSSRAAPPRAEGEAAAAAEPGKREAPGDRGDSSKYWR